MEAVNGAEDMIPSFCVGQHESKRSLPVTPQTVQRAHESGVCPYSNPILL